MNFGHINRKDEIVRFEIFFVMGKSHVYYCALNHVERLKKAKLELHWDPGVNPHTENELVKCTKITVSKQVRGFEKPKTPKDLKLMVEGPRIPSWDQTPGLRKRSDGKGAITYYESEVEGLKWREPEVIWKQPEPKVISEY